MGTAQMGALQMGMGTGRNKRVACYGITDMQHKTCALLEQYVIFGRLSFSPYALLLSLHYTAKGRDKGKVHRLGRVVVGEGNPLQ